MPAHQVDNAIVDVQGDLLDKMLSFEETTGLMKLEIAGAQFWPIVRVFSFNKILEIQGHYSLDAFKDINQKQFANNFVGRIKRTVYSVSDFALRLPVFLRIFSLRRKKFMLVPSHRKIKLANGEYFDVACVGVRDVLPSEDTLIAERYKYQKGRQPINQQNFMELAYTIFATLRELGWKQLSYADKQKLKEIATNLRAEFDVSFKFEVLFEEKLREFLIYEAVYFWLLKRISPQKIYVVCSYFMHAFIVAGKKAGARVYEIQHGLMGASHVQYNYPGQEKISYFPDVFLAHGQYWLDTTSFPGGTETYVIGAKHLDDFRRNSPTSKKRQIVFLSQPVFEYRLIDFAIELAKELTDWQVIFSLHPCDDRGYYKNRLIYMQAAPNICLSDIEKNTYDYLVESEIQVGVYTTALFEGLGLGCKSFVVELPGAGFQFMKPLLALGDAQLVRTPSDMIALIPEVKVNHSAEHYYAPLNAQLILEK